MTYTSVLWYDGECECETRGVDVEMETGIMVGKRQERQVRGGEKKTTSQSPSRALVCKFMATIDNGLFSGRQTGNTKHKCALTMLNGDRFTASSQVANREASNRQSTDSVV